MTSLQILKTHDEFYLVLLDVSFLLKLLELMMNFMPWGMFNF